MRFSKKNLKTSIFGHFGLIWVNFRQKGPFLKFPKKKAKNLYFVDSRDYVSNEKLGKSDAQFSKTKKNKNGKKLAFLVILGQTGQTLSKISEKSNRRMDKQTYIRTDVTPKVSTDHWSLD